MKKRPQPRITTARRAAWPLARRAEAGSATRWCTSAWLKLMAEKRVG
jgi:hypothetical protein